MQIKPDEITSILKSRIEGLDDGGADLSEVGTVLSVAATCSIRPSTRRSAGVWPTISSNPRSVWISSVR